MIKDYFALNLTPEDLLSKMDKYFESLESIGFNDAIDKSYNYYYGKGRYGTSSGLQAGGKQGELTEAMVNNYRSLLRHILTLITSERPSYDVRAVNTDYQSQAQAVVGEDVLNYYLRSKNLEDTLKNAAENALWSSEGFIALEWDTHSGQEFDVDPESQELVMTGDIKYSTYHAKSCIRDPYANPDDPDWVILVDKINKYELAARFPDEEDAILSNSSLAKFRKNDVSGNISADSDMIEVYKFYHKSNVVLPGGRFAYFIPDAILMEGPLPYDEIPVYRITPGQIQGMVHGYTPGYDILGLQEAKDDLFSAVLSNNIAFSRQVIAVKRDADFNVKDLTEGLSVIELDTEANGSIDDAIRPLQLTKSSSETYSLMDRIDSEQEKSTGINEVVRGDPSANLRSGNALALVAAQAIKYNSYYQQSYNQLFERVGTATIKFLQQFAAAPRFYTVVGSQNRSLLKEFKNSDIEKVDRVEVQRSSSLTNTTAGRIEIADNLLQNGMIKRPEQYISVLETGKLDPIMDKERTELLNIQSENEMLHQTEIPRALITDNHALHIREHTAVLNDPALRNMPEVVEAVLAHLSEHTDLWPQVPPAILMATGQQPPPPPAAPIPPDPNAAPQEGGANPEAMQAPESQGSDVPNMPSLPNVPEAAAPQDAEAFAQLNLQQPQ